MCCCGQPIINGQMGYKWQPNDTPIIRPPDPPPLDPDDEVLYDEPGRCGGIDSHSHHLIVVKRFGQAYLLFRHGGGVGRIDLHSMYKMSLERTLAAMDTNTRYWTLLTVYHAWNDGLRKGHSDESNRWESAFLEKRLKRRRRQGRVSVYFEPKIVYVNQLAE